MWGSRAIWNSVRSGPLAVGLHLSAFAKVVWARGGASNTLAWGPFSVTGQVCHTPVFTIHRGQSALVYREHTPHSHRRVYQRETHVRTFRLR